MPIGLVSDEDYEREIRPRVESHTPPSSRPNYTAVEVPGRAEGDINVPDSIRKLLAEEALLNGRQGALSLARDLNVSPSSASAYAAGATSTASYASPAKSLIQHLNASRQRAVKRASKTLNGALNAITQEKLDYADVKDLSGIAKDMSVIIRNLEPPPEQQKDSSSSPQFVIFAPTFRKEETFEVIDMKQE